MKPNNQRQCRLLMAMALLVFAPAAFAGTIRHANLDTMLRLSHRVLVGVCISVQPSQITFQGQYLQVTRYTFRITEDLKGSSQGEIQIVQPGWPPINPTTSSGSYQRRPLVIDGMPDYQVGEEYLLMLTRPSSIGLSSPVGLAQSAFKAVRGLDGQKLWRNGYANQGLFEGLAPESLPSLKTASSPDLTHSESGLPYQELIAWIRQRTRDAR